MNNDKYLLVSFTLLNDPSYSSARENVKPGTCTFFIYHDFTYQTNRFSSEHNYSEIKIDKGKLYYRHNSTNIFALWDEDLTGEIILDVLDIDRAIDEFLEQP